MNILSARLKKALVGVLVGVSALSASIVPVVSSPVAVEAAVKTVKPTINLKSNTFSFGVNSKVTLGNIVKTIKKGSSKIKAVKLSTPKGIKVSNLEKDPSMWWSDELAFKKKGSYTVKVTVTDVKGVSATKRVKIKVGNSLSKYVTVGPTLKVKKGSYTNDINFMSGMKYDKKYITLLFPNIFADSGFPTNKRGTFKLDYTVYAKTGETFIVQRNIKVV